MPLPDKMHRLDGGRGRYFTIVVKGLRVRLRPLTRLPGEGVLRRKKGNPSEIQRECITNLPRGKAVW